MQPLAAANSLPNALETVLCPLTPAAVLGPEKLAPLFALYFSGGINKFSLIYVPATFAQRHSHNVRHKFVSRKDAAEAVGGRSKHYGPKCMLAGKRPRKVSEKAQRRRILR